MTPDDAPEAGLASPPTEDSPSPSGPDDPPSSRRRGRQGSRTRTRRTPTAQRVSGVAGWKIATAVLTAIAVLAVGWGVYQTTRLNRTESALKVAGSTAASQIQSLDSRTAALETSNSQTASDLATLQQQFTDFTGAVAAAQEAAKDQYAKVQESLSVTPADFKTAIAQSTALSTAYLTAKAAADAAPADQEAQLKSLEAKSALLANCTKIWAGAAQQVYSADNPQEAMSTVGKDLATVAGDCKAVNG